MTLLITILLFNCFLVKEFCKRLHNMKPYYVARSKLGFPIYAIGRTSKHMWLITDDWYIYEMPLDAFNETTQKLHLKGEPMHISQKWPNLVKTLNDSSEKGSKSLAMFYDTFFVSDSFNNEYLFAFVSNKVDDQIDPKGPYRCWVFDITRQKLFDRYRFVAYYSVWVFPRIERHNQ